MSVLENMKRREEADPSKPWQKPWNKVRFTVDYWDYCNRVYSIWGTVEHLDYCNRVYSIPLQMSAEEQAEQRKKNMEEFEQLERVENEKVRTFNLYITDFYVYDGWHVEKSNTKYEFLFVGGIESPLKTNAPWKEEVHVKHRPFDTYYFRIMKLETASACLSNVHCWSIDTVALSRYRNPSPPALPPQRSSSRNDDHSGTVDKASVRWRHQAIRGNG